jgi:hypothetical protein
MADDRKRFSADPLIDEQEELAAREAAAIGGVAGDEELDPAQRPVIEAGGGQAEGFELAEHDLIRHASHGDDRPDGIIFHDAGRPEAESDRQTGEFSEADSVSRSSKPTDED